MVPTALKAKHYSKSFGLFYKEVGVTWRVSDCEELSLARGGIERPSHGFKLDSQTHY